MSLPFPHEHSPGGEIRETIVDAIYIAQVADEPNTGAVYLTHAESQRRLLWKFDPAVGRQVAAAILNLCDAMEQDR